MATVASLPTRGLSEAKAALSDVMSGVVHDHQPTVIERHGGKEAMLLLGLSDMGPLLDHFSFHTLSSVSTAGFSRGSLTFSTAPCRCGYENR